MVNIVIYARFSSHSQTEQSIEGQLKECYEFAKRNDYNVIAEYIDRALTGTTDKRPEFLRMIEDSKKKAFKYVLVYQLDRFARNRYDSATYKAKLKKNGVRVLSAKENITEDASGILVEGVLESMAEYYSVELSQKIKRGIEVSASKCQFFGGAVPLGYYIDQDKHYQINENEAVFVRKIFEMYADGKTVVEIEKFLLDNKIFNKGKTIGHGTVKRILHNRRYLGYYIFHDKEIKDGIPQIISEELYEAVQGRLQRNNKAPSSKKAKEPFLLTTKLFCALCESSMTGVSGTSHTGKKYAYYRCFGKKDGCKQENVPKDLIEEAVIQDTLKLLDDKLIDKISQALYDILQEELKNGNVPRLKKLLAANKKATDNLMQLLMDGKAKNTILEKLDQLEKERKEIELQLEVEKSEILDFKLEDLRYYVKRFKHLDYTKTENRQALIDTFVNKVINYGNKKGKVRYNVTDFSTGSLYERVVEQKNAQREIEEQLKSMRSSGGNVQARGASATVDSLLVRAGQELESGNFNEATSYYKRVLDANPKSAEAWWGVFLAGEKTTSSEKLIASPSSKKYNAVMKNRNYLNAKKYALGHFKEKIESFDKIMAQNAEKRIAEIKVKIETNIRESEEFSEKSKRQLKQYEAKAAELTQKHAQQEQIVNGLKSSAGKKKKAPLWYDCSFGLGVLLIGLGGGLIMPLYNYNLGAVMACIGIITLLVISIIRKKQQKNEGSLHASQLQKAEEDLLRTQTEMEDLAKRAETYAAESNAKTDDFLRSRNLLEEENDICKQFLDFLFGDNAA